MNLKLLDSCNDGDDVALFVMPTFDKAALRKVSGNFTAGICNIMRRIIYPFLAKTKNFMEPEDTPEAVGDGSEEEGVNILTFVQASIIPSVTRSPRSPSRNCLLLPNLASTGRFYIGQVLDLYKRGRYVAPIPATAPSSWLQLHRVCLGCLMCLLTCTFTTGAYISFCVHNNFISNIPFLDSW
jgi:hypothetical protein